LQLSKWPFLPLVRSALTTELKAYPIEQRKALNHNKIFAAHRLRSRCDSASVTAAYAQRQLNIDDASTVAPKIYG